MQSGVEKVWIPGPAGRLEGRILDNGASRWALLCHPHPQYGGTMDNKVVTTVERTLQQLGWSTLVFNFRGAGGSEGAFDNGIGEQADLMAVHAWLQARHQPQRLLLGGFSFGAYVTLNRWQAVEADALLSIAPPVGLWDFGALVPPQTNWTVIQGGGDEVVSPAAVLAWLAAQPAMPTLYWRAGVSHFFHGQLVWLKGVIELEYKKTLI